MTDTAPPKERVSLEIPDVDAPLVQFKNDESLSRILKKEIARLPSNFVSIVL